MKIELDELPKYTTEQVINNLITDIGGLEADMRNIRVLINHKMEIITHLQELVSYQKREVKDQ